MIFTPWVMPRRWFGSRRPLRLVFPRPSLRCPSFEQLEDRTLLAGHTLAAATPLSFPPTSPYQTTSASGFLDSGTAVDVYAVTLAAGDTLTAQAAAQAVGSGLDSYLRLFDGTGQQLFANDNANGTDAALTVQVSSSGTYYLGVSRATNASYNLLLPPPAGDPSQAGIYTLNLSKPAVPPAAVADLMASEFRVTSGPAQWGDTVTVLYQVDNRGAQAGTFNGQVKLAASSDFSAGGTVLASAGPLAMAADSSSGLLSLSVVLPAVAPAGFPATGPVYLGLVINGAAVAQQQGSAWDAVNILPVQSEAEPNDTLPTAEPLVNLNGRVDGSVNAAGDSDNYQCVIPAAAGSGNLTATLQPGVPGLALRLELRDASGTVIVTSDGSGTGGGPTFRQNLAPGTYYLCVKGLQGGSGGYTLTTQFVAGPSPSRPLPLGGQPLDVVVADVNGDGLLDLAVSNYAAIGVSVILGNGDGTFRPPQTYPVQISPGALAVADLNGDGRPDLVVSNYGSASLSLLQGNGDGTFQPARPLAVGVDPKGIAIADVNLDGRPDLVVVDDVLNTAEVLLGNGDGTFQAPRSVPVGGRPRDVAVADFNGDGLPDLAVANYGSGTAGVLLGNGDGTFQTQQTYPVGSGTNRVVVADFNGDGKLDLAADADGGARVGTIVVLLGNGDGTFQSQRISSPAKPVGLATGDVNGDGRLDLLTSSVGSGTVGVLLGNGDGSFQGERPLAVGGKPKTVAVADLNGDGRPDLVQTNFGNDSVGVLLGNGDGTFLGGTAALVGTKPTNLVVADLNGDGRPDTVTSNLGSANVSVLLGNGDGTFQPQQTFPVGSHPYSLAVAEINGDGRPDLAVANYGDNTVGILLGNGDGTFQPQQTYPVGGEPNGVTFADLNGDGHPDLALANYGDNTVSVLLGNPDGTFQPQQIYPVGQAPYTVVVADLNGDGYLDLAAANFGDATVSVLLGNGDGTFRPQRTFAVGGKPTGVAAADVNGDGSVDLITPNRKDGTVSVLLGNGDGTFRPQQAFAVGARPNGVAVADVNGDGRLDLAAPNSDDGTMSVLLGNGDGTFRPQQVYPVGAQPNGVSIIDVNGDGSLDLLTANFGAGTVSVLLGNGDGTFSDAAAIASPTGAVPRLASFSDPLVPDSLTLRDDGTILYRRAIPGEPGAFAPPLAVNPDDRPARDFALFSTTRGTLVAAVDRSFDPNTRLGAVSLYAYDPATGAFQRSGALSLPAGNLSAARILAADLTSSPDGQPHDLAVFCETSGTLTLFLSDGQGGFLPPQVIFVGFGVSALATAPGLSGLDIVLTNQATGAVIDLVNDGTGHFAARSASQFRAAPGPFGFDVAFTPAQAQSLQRPFGLVVGDFLNDGRADIVAINSSGDNLVLLDGQGGGSYLTRAGQPLGFSPSYAAAGDFNGDGNLDLVLLDSLNGTVVVYLGDGRGHFSLKATYLAGNAPTGITVADVTRPGGGGPDGYLDLLVGNSFGDVLVLAGHGDGTFQPYERVEHGIALAVADLRHDGQDAFIFANQGLDQVNVQYGTGSSLSILASAQDAQPVLGPGAVRLVDLNDDGVQDLVVANSGSNNILVFLGNPDGTFKPALSRFAGDSPVGITVADVNGDGTPDLVIANQGSNDVSVFYGKGAGATWTLIAGPRLSSGGRGPTSTAVQDVNGDGIPDILASNRDTNNVGLVPGVGGGFFNDTNPQPEGTPGSGLRIVPTGPNPGPVIPVVTARGPGFIVLDGGGRTLTELEGFSGNAFRTVLTIDTGGFTPTSVVAADFNDDGLTDLIIANANAGGLADPGRPDNGTGDVALLLGTDSGFDVVETFTDPDMPSPSAVALSALEGNVFYATTEGLEHAFRFEINLPTAPPEEPTTSPVKTFEPVSDSPIAFAPGLVPDTPLVGYPELVQRPTSGGQAPDLSHPPDAEGSDRAFSSGALSLVVTPEGGKGQGNLAWQRVTDALAEAREGWAGQLAERVGEAWQTLGTTVEEVKAEVASLADAAGRTLGLDNLRLPPLNWSPLAASLADIATDSVRILWPTSARADAGQDLSPVAREFDFPRFADVPIDSGADEPLPATWLRPGHHSPLRPETTPPVLDASPPGIDESPVVPLRRLTAGTDFISERIPYESLLQNERLWQLMLATLAALPRPSALERREERRPPR